jgi:hypothetical protein
MDLHTLFYVVGILLVVGVLLWGLTQLTFVDADVKQGIKVLTIIIAAIWVLSLFFPIGHLVK